MFGQARLSFYRDRWLLFTSCRLITKFFQEQDLPSSVMSLGFWALFLSVLPAIAHSSLTSTYSINPVAEISGHFSQFFT